MPTALNLELVQGANFSQTIAVGEAFNGMTARAHARTAFAGGRLVEFTCSAISGGNVTLSLTAAQTADVPAPVWVRDDVRTVPVGWWDLEVESGAGVVTRTHDGEVRLRREITR